MNVRLVSETLDEVGKDEHERCLAKLAARMDEVTGLHGPDSLVWRYHGESVVFLGGAAAALLQLAHPPVAAAICEHSKTLEDVAGRFERTFRHVFAMTFGPRDEAIKAARTVHKIHTHIRGTIGEDVGMYSRSDAYAANARDSLRWVYATLVHTVVDVYAAIGRPIPHHHLDDYYNETKAFAMLFGLDEYHLPVSWKAFDDYFQSTLESSKIAVGQNAKQLAHFLLAPTRRIEAPLMRVIKDVTAELLSPSIAEAYGLSAGGRRAKIALTLARHHFAMPGALRRLPACVEAEARCKGTSPGKIVAIKRGLFRRLHSLRLPAAE